MKSTEKKIRTQINKQTWPESWKEMKGKVGSCHGITQKSVRTEKMILQVWIARWKVLPLFLDGSLRLDKHAKEEIQLMQNPKQRANKRPKPNKSSRKTRGPPSAFLGIAATLWLHREGSCRSLGRSAMCWEKEAGGWLVSKCQQRIWQRSGPREGYILKWEFSCPTCLSCKTDDSSFGGLRIPHCLQLCYFSGPLCQLHFFKLYTSRNNASLLQSSQKGDVTKPGMF